MNEVKRGIYLVANYKSQQMCENLIYSIRNGGCMLPIRLINFGGKEINSVFIKEQVEIVHYDSFPDEAKQLIGNILSVLPGYLPGLVYRYLAWFSDWDEFIYSDNDIVALCNWNNLFNYLNEYDFVHADQEFITGGKFDYFKPEKLKSIFGEKCLDSLLTSGHITVKKNSRMIDDINNAVKWFKDNPDIPKKNDQSLMHIACLIGRWRKLNLCMQPNNWLSTWAGDYKNSLQLIQQIQCTPPNQITHIHYSGGTPGGQRPIEELLFSNLIERKRLKRLGVISNTHLSGLAYVKFQIKRSKRILKSLIDKR